MVEDADEEDEVNVDPMASDIPFDIEEGDRMWATGLIPEAQYIQASSTISQRLAEGFAKNAEANPTPPVEAAQKTQFQIMSKSSSRYFQRKGLRNFQTANHGITQSN